MRKVVVFIILLTFMATNMGQPFAQVVGVSQPSALLLPGNIIHLTEKYEPAVLKGIKVDLQDPFRLNFIMQQGDLAREKDSLAGDQALQAESLRLIKYFLVSLTVPETDLWVNLSPYEKDRITSETFGQTEMGKDLLVLDYELKQVMASLLHPDDVVGKAFWREVYAKAYEKFGTTDIPFDTFNKVWITTDKAEVYEKPQAGVESPAGLMALVTREHLKVMLESDYLSSRQAACQDEACRRNVSGAPQDLPADQALARDVIREVVIPVIEKEVNEGARFSQLRQMYHSLILATWYKRKLVHAILTEVYADQNKLYGVTHGEADLKDKIWARYVETFRKGVYSLIREEVDPVTQEVVPRKYFSGGAVLRGDFSETAILPETPAMQAADFAQVTVDLAQNLKVPDKNSGFTASLDYKKDLEAPLTNGIRQPWAKELTAVLSGLSEVSTGRDFPGIFQVLNKLYVNELAKMSDPKNKNQKLKDNTFGLIRALAEKVPLRNILDKETLAELTGLPSEETREFVKLALQENDIELLQATMIDFLENDNTSSAGLRGQIKELTAFLWKLADIRARLPLKQFINLDDFRLDLVLKDNKDSRTTFNSLIRKDLFLNDVANLRRQMLALRASGSSVALGVVRKIEARLAYYGYDPQHYRMADRQGGASSLNMPKDLDVAIEVANDNLNSLLKMARDGNGQVLKSIATYLEGLKKGADHERIFKGIARDIWDRIAYMRRSYIDKMANDLKGRQGNSSILKEELASDENARLLGFEALDVGILRAYKVFMGNQTNVTFTRLKRQLVQYQDLGFETIPKKNQIENHIVKLNAMLVQHVQMDLVDEAWAQAREDKLLQRDFSLERLKGLSLANLSWTYEDLMAALMQGTGADINAVTAYLAGMNFTRSYFARRDFQAPEPEDELAPLGYPLYFSTAKISSSYIDRSLLEKDKKGARLRQAIEEIKMILRGAPGKTQSFARIFRGKHEPYAVYVRVSGVVLTSKLNGLSAAEKQSLREVILAKHWGALLAGRDSELVIFKEADIDLDLFLENYLAAKPKDVRDWIHFVFEQARKDRKVIIVAWDKAAKFKKTSDDKSINTSFSKYLEQVSDVEEPEHEILEKKDQAMGVNNPGGIDLNPAGMDLAVRGQANDGSSVECAGNPSRCGSFDLTPQQLAAMRANLNGFDPVIVRIIPHVNVPSFLGLAR